MEKGDTMFGLSKYGKYRKVSLLYGLSDIEDFFEGTTKCNLYRSYQNPMKKRDAEECIDTRSSFHMSGQKLFIGMRNFDYSYNGYKKMALYLGKDLVIRLPRGYEGNYVYYRIEKV